MKHYLRFILVLLLSTVWCVGGYSQETVTDDLTCSVLGLSSKGYTKFSGKKAKSDAEYSGWAYNNGSNIQIKTKKQDSKYYTGIVSSVSGGKIKKIIISDVQKDKSIDIYCSNNVYSSPDDLFGSNAGTKVGTITSSNSSVEISGDYSYIGIRSNSGAVYMYKITIVWEKVSSKTPTNTTFGTDVDKDTITITEGEPFPTHVATMTTEGVTGTIAYASDNAAVNVDQNGVTSAGTGFGMAKITATFTPTDAETYASSSAYYYIDYKEKTKPATAISFEKPNVTRTTLDYASFTGQTATLKAGETTLTNELAYSKEDAAGVITTLNNDGTLVLSGKAGTATVTAAFAGNTEYASSSKSYTITVRKVYGNIAELKKVLTTTEKEYSLNLKDAVVTGIYDNKDKYGNFNVYIEDASAGILIYYPNANNDFKVGQKINGEVTIKGTTYNSLPEITSWTATESCTVIDGADVPLTTVTIAELSANFDKYESRRVKIENATVTTGTATANYSGKIAQGESELTLRTKAVAVTTTKDDVIDVIGYPATYRSYQQFSVWSQDDVIVKSSVVKTTLSFEPATTEYNVDNNNKDAFTAPTATVKDAEGNVVEGAAITYASSKPGVATVGETDGKVTFVGFGTTVITASYDGDATHMASSNSYSINYGKVKTTMSWSAPTATANLGETSFDAPTLTLKAGDTDILAGKTIKYSSSATDVAEISAEGTVKIKAEGTTVITATFDGDDTYAGASAEYTLTVTDPNKPEEKNVTFDFTKPYDYGYGRLENDGDYKELEETNVIQSDNVTITNVKSGGANGYTNKNAFRNKNGEITLRFYTNAEATVSVPTGYEINKIEFVTDNTSDQITITPELYNPEKSTWTGSANSVSLEFKSTVKFTSMTVYYAKATPEVTYGTINFIAHDAEGYRYATFSSDKNVVFTDDVVVSGVSITNGKLNVTDFTSGNYDVTDAEKGNVKGYYVPANTGVLVNCIAETATYYFPNTTTTQTVTLPANQLKPAPVGGVEFTAETGYKYYKLAYDNYTAQTGLGFYWGAKNGGAFKVKAGTAYLAVPASEANNAKGFAFDGETTGIENVNMAANQSKTIYNLNGQRVSNMSQAGLYIVNGKKVVIRK